MSSHNPTFPDDLSPIQLSLTQQIYNSIIQNSPFYSFASLTSQATHDNTVVTMSAQPCTKKRGFFSRLFRSSDTTDVKYIIELLEQLITTVPKEQIRELLDYTDGPFFTNFTILSFACYHSLYDVVRWLHKHGASLIICHAITGQTPLSIACASPYFTPATTKLIKFLTDSLLLEYNPSPTQITDDYQRERANSRSRAKSISSPSSPLSQTPAPPNQNLTLTQFKWLIHRDCNQLTAPSYILRSGELFNEYHLEALEYLFTKCPILYLCELLPAELEILLSQQPKSAPLQVLAKALYGQVGYQNLVVELEERRQEILANQKTAEREKLMAENAKKIEQNNYQNQQKKKLAQKIIIPNPIEVKRSQNGKNLPVITPVKPDTSNNNNHNNHNNHNHNNNDDDTLDNNDKALKLRKLKSVGVENDNYDNHQHFTPFNIISSRIPSGFHTDDIVDDKHPTATNDTTKGNNAITVTPKSNNGRDGGNTIQIRGRSKTPLESKGNQNTIEISKKGKSTLNVYQRQDNVPLLMNSPSMSYLPILHLLSNTNQIKSDIWKKIYKLVLKYVQIEQTPLLSIPGSPFKQYVQLNLFSNPFPHLPILSELKKKFQISFHNYSTLGLTPLMLTLVHSQPWNIETTKLVYFLTDPNTSPLSIHMLKPQPPGMKAQSKKIQPDMLTVLEFALTLSTKPYISKSALLLFKLIAEVDLEAVNRVVDYQPIHDLFSPISHRNPHFLAQIIDQFGNFDNFLANIPPNSTTFQQIYGIPYQKSDSLSTFSAMYHHSHVIPYLQLPQNGSTSSSTQIPHRNQHPVDVSTALERSIKYDPYFSPTFPHSRRVFLSDSDLPTVTNLHSLPHITNQGSSVVAKGNIAGKDTNLFPSSPSNSTHTPLSTPLQQAQLSLPPSSLPQIVQLPSLNNKNTIAALMRNGNQNEFNIATGNTPLVVPKTHRLSTIPDSTPLPPLAPLSSQGTHPNTPTSALLSFNNPPKPPVYSPTQPPTLLNFDNPTAYATPFIIHYPTLRAIKWFHQYPPPQSILTPRELEMNKFDTRITAIGPQKVRSKLESKLMYRSTSPQLYNPHYSADEVSNPYPCFLFTTPLHLLCSHPMFSLDIIFYLWTHGADLNIARHGDEPLLFFIVQSFTPPQLPADTTTSLHLQQQGVISNTNSERRGSFAMGGHRRTKSRTVSMSVNFTPQSHQNSHNDQKNSVSDNKNSIASNISQSNTIQSSTNQSVTTQSVTTQSASQIDPSASISAVANSIINPSQQYLQSAIPPHTGLIYPLEEPVYTKQLEKAISRSDLSPEDLVILNDCKKLPKEHNIDRLSVFLHCILRHQFSLGLKSPSHIDYQDDDVKKTIQQNSSSDVDYPQNQKGSKTPYNSPISASPSSVAHFHGSSASNSVSGARGVSSLKSPLATDYELPYSPALGPIIPLDFATVSHEYHGFFYYLLSNPSISPQEATDIAVLMVHYKQFNAHLVLEDIFTFLHNPLNQRLALSYGPLQSILQVLFSPKELLQSISSHQNYTLREIGLNVDLLHAFLLYGNLLLPSSLDLFLFFIQIGFQPGSCGPGPILDTLGDPLRIGKVSEGTYEEEYSTNVKNTILSQTTTHLRHYHYGSNMYRLFALITTLINVNPTFNNSIISVALFAHLKQLSNQNMHNNFIKNNTSFNNNHENTNSVSTSGGYQPYSILGQLGGDHKKEIVDESFSSSQISPFPLPATASGNSQHGPMFGQIYSGRVHKNIQPPPPLVKIFSITKIIAKMTSENTHLIKTIIPTCQIFLLDAIQHSVITPVDQISDKIIPITNPSDAPHYVSLISPNTPDAIKATLTQHPTQHNFSHYLDTASHWKGFSTNIRFYIYSLIQSLKLLISYDIQQHLEQQQVEKNTQKGNSRGNAANNSTIFSQKYETSYDSDTISNDYIRTTSPILKPSAVLNRNANKNNNTKNVPNGNKISQNGTNQNNTPVLNQAASRPGPKTPQHSYPELNIVPTPLELPKQRVPFTYQQTTHYPLPEKEPKPYATFPTQKQNDKIARSIRQNHKSSPNLANSSFSSQTSPLSDIVQLDLKYIIFLACLLEESPTSGLQSPEWKNSLRLLTSNTISPSHDSYSGNTNQFSTQNSYRQQQRQSISSTSPSPYHNNQNFNNTSAGSNQASNSFINSNTSLNILTEVKGLFLLLIEWSRYRQLDVFTSIEKPKTMSEAREHPHVLTFGTKYTPGAPQHYSTHPLRASITAMQFEQVKQHPALFILSTLLFTPFTHDVMDIIALSIQLSQKQSRQAVKRINGVNIDPNNSKKGSFVQREISTPFPDGLSEFNTTPRSLHLSSDSSQNSNHKLSPQTNTQPRLLGSNASHPQLPSATGKYNDWGNNGHKNPAKSISKIDQKYQLSTIPPQPSKTYLNPNDLLFLLLNLPSVVTPSSMNSAPLYPLFELIFKTFDHIALDATVQQTPAANFTLLRPDFIQNQIYQHANPADPIFSVLPTFVTYFGSTMVPLLCPYDERLSKLQRLSSSTMGFNSQSRQPQTVLREQLGLFQSSTGLLASNVTTTTSSTSTSSQQIASKSGPGRKASVVMNTVGSSQPNPPSAPAPLLSLVKGSVVPLPNIEHHLLGFVSRQNSLETADGVLIQPPIDLSKGMLAFYTGFFPIINKNSISGGKFRSEMANDDFSTKNFDNFYQKNQLFDLTGFNALHLLFLPKNLPAPIPNSAVTIPSTLTEVAGLNLFRPLNTIPQAQKSQLIPSTPLNPSLTTSHGGNSTSNRSILVKPDANTQQSLGVTVNLKSFTVNVNNNEAQTSATPTQSSPNVDQDDCIYGLPATAGLTNSENLNTIKQLVPLLGQRIKFPSGTIEDLSDITSTIANMNKNANNSCGIDGNTVNGSSLRGFTSQFDTVGRPFVSNEKNDQESDFLSVTTCQPLHADIQTDLVELFLLANSLPPPLPLPTTSNKHNNSLQLTTTQSTKVDLYAVTSHGDTVMDLLLFSPCLLYGKRSPLCNAHRGLFCKCGYTKQTVQILYSLFINHDYNPNLAPISPYGGEQADDVPFQGGLTSVAFQTLLDSNALAPVAAIAGEYAAHHSQTDYRESLGDLSSHLPNGGPISPNHQLSLLRHFSGTMAPQHPLSPNAMAGRSTMNLGKDKGKLQHRSSLSNIFSAAQQQSMLQNQRHGSMADLNTVPDKPQLRLNRSSHTPANPYSAIQQGALFHSSGNTNGLGLASPPTPMGSQSFQQPVFAPALSIGGLSARASVRDNAVINTSSHNRTSVNQLRAEMLSFRLPQQDETPTIIGNGNRGIFFNQYDNSQLPLSPIASSPPGSGTQMSRDFSQALDSPRQTPYANGKAFNPYIASPNHRNAPLPPPPSPPSTSPPRLPANSYESHSDDMDNDAFGQLPRSRIAPGPPTPIIASHNRPDNYSQDDSLDNSSNNNNNNNNNKKSQLDLISATPGRPSRFVSQKIALPNQNGSNTPDYSLDRVDSATGLDLLQFHLTPHHEAEDSGESQFNATYNALHTVGLQNGETKPNSGKKLLNVTLPLAESDSDDFIIPLHQPQLLTERTATTGLTMNFKTSVTGSDVVNLEQFHQQQLQQQQQRTVNPSSLLAPLWTQNHYDELQTYYNLSNQPLKVYQPASLRHYFSPNGSILETLFSLFHHNILPLTLHVPQIVQVLLYADHYIRPLQTSPVPGVTVTVGPSCNILWSFLSAQPIPPFLVNHREYHQLYQSYFTPATINLNAPLGGVGAGPTNGLGPGLLTPMSPLTPSHANHHHAAQFESRRSSFIVDEFTMQMAGIPTSSAPNNGRHKQSTHQPPSQPKQHIRSPSLTSPSRPHLQQRNNLILASQLNPPVTPIKSSVLVDSAASPAPPHFNQDLFERTSVRLSAMGQCNILPTHSVMLTTKSDINNKPVALMSLFQGRISNKGSDSSSQPNNHEGVRIGLDPVPFNNHVAAMSQYSMTSLGSHTPTVNYFGGAKRKKMTKMEKLKNRLTAKQMLFQASIGVPDPLTKALKFQKLHANVTIPPLQGPNVIVTETQAQYVDHLKDRLKVGMVRKAQILSKYHRVLYKLHHETQIQAKSNDIDSHNKLDKNDKKKKTQRRTSTISVAATVALSMKSKPEKDHRQLSNIFQPLTPQQLANASNYTTTNIPHRLPPNVNHYWFEILDLLLATGCELPLFAPAHSSKFHPITTPPHPQYQQNNPAASISILATSPVPPGDPILLTNAILALPEARFISTFLTAALNPSRYYSPLPTDAQTRASPQYITPAFVGNILNSQLNILKPALDFLFKNATPVSDSSPAQPQTHRLSTGSITITTPMTKPVLMVALYILSYSLFWSFNPSSHRGNTQYLTPLQAFANNDSLRDQVLIHANENLMLLSVTNITKLSLFDLLQVTTTPPQCEINTTTVTKETIPLPFGVDWNGPCDPVQLNLYNPGLVLNGGVPSTPNNEIVLPPHFLWDLFRSTPVTKQLTKCNLYDIMVMLTNCCWNPYREDQLVIEYSLPRHAEVFFLNEDTDGDLITSTKSTNSDKLQNKTPTLRPKQPENNNTGKNNEPKPLTADVQPEETLIYVHYQPYVDKYIADKSKPKSSHSRQSSYDRNNGGALQISSQSLTLNDITVVSEHDISTHRNYYILNTPHGLDVTLRDPDSLTGETLLQQAITRKMPSCVLFALIALYGIDTIVEPINAQFKPLASLLTTNKAADNDEIEEFYPYSNALTIHTDFSGRNVLDYMLAFHTVRHAPDVFNFILSHCEQEVLQQLQKDSLL
jgi:hypothetical protein